MSDRSRPPFFRRSVAAVAIVAGAVWIGGFAAHSQSSGSGSMLRPSQMERMIEAGGYRLTGPVVRHGQIYLADVIGPEDNEERLVFDARDGRLLRHAPGESRQSATPDGRSPVATFFANLFGAQEDVAPLSPPPASDFLETPKPKPAAKRPKSSRRQSRRTTRRMRRLRPLRRRPQARRSQQRLRLPRQPAVSRLPRRPPKRLPPVQQRRRRRLLRRS
jgi:hypothetical protein